MKKLLTLLLTIALITTLTACGNEKEMELVDTTQDIDNELPETMYGKITGIVGNELEVALVKMPDVEADPAPSEEEAPDDLGDTVVAATMTSAIASTDNVAENVELTGESVTLNVPAGVSIISFGEESTLSSLKKGSLISITVNNSDDMNVLSIALIQE